LAREIVAVIVTRARESVGRRESVTIGHAPDHAHRAPRTRRL
jgi:hypothetical protein